MEFNNFTVSLNCRLDRKDSQDKVPLYLFINQGNQRKKISLDMRISVKLY